MKIDIMKVLRCGVIGGIILFIWGAFFWKGLFGGTMHPTNAFADEERVTDVIKDNAPVSGIYTLPNMHKNWGDKEAFKAAKEQRRHGPTMFAAISLEGRGSGKTSIAIKFLIYKIVLASIVAGFLVRKASKYDYKKSVKFVTWVGLLIALGGTMPYAIIFGFPFQFTALVFAEIVIGWFLAGLVMVRFAK